MQIPSEDDPQQLPDPFSDLAVGGWEVTDEPVGRLSVWAVTLQGKVRPPQSCGWEVVDRATHTAGGGEAALAGLLGE